MEKMELRSTRSRSKSRTSPDKDSINETHASAGQTIIRTTRSSTMKTTTISSDDENITNITHTLEPRATKPVKMNRTEKSIKKTHYITSDYSSEDGDNHVSSTDLSEQNLTNQLFENARRSASRSTGSVSALDFYRAAGDYWNKYPKTDYTYSPNSKDRKELAPGVVAMPNMSRKSLHSYDYDYILTHNKHTNTDISEHDYASKSTYTLQSNSENWSKIRQRPLYSNNNSDDRRYYYSSKSSLQKQSFIMRILTTITSIFISIFKYVGHATYSVYNVQNSIFMWLGKKIHQATTRIMYWDTWLLQSSNNKRKLRWLLALCLIPLLIFGGWWLLSGLGPLLYGTFNNIPSSILQSSPFLLATNNDKGHTANFNTQDDKNHIIQISPSSHRKLEEKVITIPEKIILEPPKANEIAAEFTSEQLQEISKSIKYSLDLENDYNIDAIIARILENPSIRDVIEHYNKLTVKVEEGEHKSMSESILRNQQSVIDDLREEINRVKLDLSSIRSESIQNNMRLAHQFKRCCRNSVIHIESYVTKIIKDLLGAPGYLSSQKDISDWLHATFIAKQDLEIHIANLTHHLRSNYEDMIRNSEQLIMDKVMAEISKELNFRIERIQKHEAKGELKLDSLTDEHIRKIVTDALALYDADKTGLVDYALESAGGHVLSTRCTESYQARTAVLSVFGIPLWYPSNTPRTVITPGMTPGECWAFQNFPGFLLVKLSAPIKITAFSMEHISKSLAPNGKIDSAPKEFSVYGLRNESDKNLVLLGKYMYDYDGTSLQYFDVQNDGLIFDIIELRIHSNHGNPNYTCLYRFRVHGILSTEPR